MRQRQCAACRGYISNDPEKARKHDDCQDTRADVLAAREARAAIEAMERVQAELQATPMPVKDEREKTPGRHPNKVIVKVADGHFVVHCKRCGGKRDRQHRATAAECEDWYREHAASGYHRNFGRRAFDESPEAVLLRRIFGGT